MILTAAAPWPPGWPAPPGLGSTIVYNPIVPVGGGLVRLYTDMSLVIVSAHPALLTGPTIVLLTPVQSTTGEITTGRFVSPFRAAGLLTVPAPDRSNSPAKFTASPST